MCCSQGHAERVCDKDGPAKQVCLLHAGISMSCTCACNSLASPLDDLIDQLGGVSSVAEMTGRKGRIVRGEDSKLKYELRDAEGEALESLNNSEVCMRC